MLLVLACTGCDLEPTGPARAYRPIVGGTETAGDPAVVELSSRTSTCNAAPEVYCTGSIVGPRAVLTAAHCVATEPLASIRAGGVDVEAAYLHPDYGDADDIALVVLAEAVAIAPVALRRAPMTTADVGADVRLVGYGVDETGATGTKREGTARITAIDARTFDIEPGPAMSCGGDSGGPAFLGDELAGLVAFGDGACEVLGVNTRVDAYVDDFIDPTVAAIAALPPAPPRPAFDPATSFCDVACAVDSDCPRAMGCVDTAEGRRCALAGGDVGVFEGECTADDGCGDGTCVTGLEGDICRCFLRCDQRAPAGCCASGGGGGAGATLAVLALLAWRRRRALAALLVLAACGEDPAPTGPLFVDITASTGLDTGVVLADPGDRPCAEPTPYVCTVRGASFGVGGAAADIDGDGRVDLYLAGPDGGRLWSNRTAPDGPIALTEAGGLPGSSEYVHGAAFGDLDGDGDADLVLATAAAVRLLVNDGQGVFADRTDALAITRAIQRSPSVSLGDIDGDGRLDIHLSEYGVPGTASTVGEPGLLLLNRGDLVFEDIAGAWPRRHAWASLLADFDRDGRLDIFIATETWGIVDEPQPSSLYFNEGGDPPVFVENAALADDLSRLSTPMGAVAGDIDGDGNLEVLVSVQGPALYITRPPGAGPRALSADSFFGPPGALEAYQTAWGGALEDFDRDGELEGLLIGGAPCLPDDCAPIPPSQPSELFDYEERRFAYEHAVRVDDAGGLNGPPGAYRNQRGLIRVDLGGDGRDELVVTPFNDQFRIYQQVAQEGASESHYLRLELRGTRSAPTPVGAEVTVTAGGRVYWRQLTAGGSTHTSHGPGMVLELGAAAVYDAIEIRWPDGTRESLAGGPADTTLVVHQSDR